MANSSVSHTSAISSSRGRRSGSHRVVVVAIPRAPLFELSVACEVFGFGAERRALTPDWYDLSLCSPEPGAPIGPGLVTGEVPGLEELDTADTVVVPACASPLDQPPGELVEAVRRAHRRGARVVSICTGAFVLAEAGLLDGRRATTHWMHADLLAARYPSVRVDPTVLYVHDDVWTSAGSAAGIDLCLELVRRDLGASVANEVSRRIVTPPHRDGGQAQFIRYSPERVDRDGSLHAWVRENLADVTVARMALHAGSSQRSLIRAFRARTGMTPQAWLQRERLSAAQELLEGTDLTLEAIARRVGLGTATNLRAQFTRTFGVPPSSYRHTFRRTSA